MVHRAAVGRLTVVDELFLLGADGLLPGGGSVLQGLLRFDEPVPPAALADAHAALAAGPLSVLVGESRVLFARRYFRPADGAPSLRVETRPVHDVLTWADTRAAVPLGVRRGAPWEVATAPLASGGTIVSLVCSHVVADAARMARAARQDGVASPGSGRRRPGIVDDAVDAARLLRRVSAGVTRSLGRGIVDADARAALFAASRPRPTRPTWRPGRRPPTIVVDVDAARFDAAARPGSTTALLCSLAATVAASVDPTLAAVQVAVPMRTPGGLLTAGVSVAPGAGLAAIRAAARAAYRDASAGAGPHAPPAGMPAELLQVLGRRTAAALAADPGSGDCFASDLSPLGAMFERIGDHRASGLAVRAVRPGLTAAAAAATSSIASLWATRCAGLVTVSVTASDSRVADRAALARLTADALERHGLTGSAWTDDGLCTNQ